MRMKDELDFERLFKNYYSRLFFFSLQMLGDEDESHDLVHGVFEELWRKFPEIDEDRVQSWLYTLARNRCINQLRRRNVHEQYVCFCQSVTADYAGDTLAERDERDKLVRAVLERLDPPARDIFTECFLKEQRYQDVADKTGRSLSSIKKIMASVLKKIGDHQYKKIIMKELL